MDSTYVHALDGRLRIKIPDLKRSPETADRICRCLRKSAGIRYAKTNPLTGNLLVLFEPSATNHSKIMRSVEIKRLSALRSPAFHRDEKADHPARKLLTEYLLLSAVEFLIERLLLALI